jgi:geranylgeranyl diphosphate synthase, type II
MSAFESADLSAEFASCLPLPEGLDPHLEEALLHVLDAPGSLVRPRIVLQMALAFGIARVHAKDLAIALEYFHTASLVFDDLPSMDNGVQRRGSPCVHVAYGEAGAILAALALINRAYALSWRAVSECPPDRRSQALTYLEERLGVHGLLDGQSRDLHYATLPHDQQTNRQIAYGKTVSLIRLTLVLPAMLGGASLREIQLLERLSTYWGLSYQIADDLKDLLRSDAESGKTGSRDVLLDRPNTALALGIPAAVDLLNRLIRIGDRTLDRLLISRPSVSFLSRLRRDLQEEVTRANEDARRMTPGRS